MGGGRIGGALRAARTTAVTSAAGLGRPRRWLAGLAWVLWALAMLGLAVVPWMDRLIIRAGRPDLAQLVPGSIVGPLLAVLGAATVGAVLASRRPRHPVGWLLLGFALSLTASGVISSYVTYGLVARPGALPAADTVARYYPATGAAALALLSLVLLLTPTGSLPSARWRWWAVITAATPVALVLVVPVAPGRLTRSCCSPAVPSATGPWVGSCWSPLGLPWLSPPWPWPSPPGRWWCGSAAPTGSSASSCAGWR